jgi:hypothetical protein
MGLEAGIGLLLRVSYMPWLRALGLCWPWRVGHRGPLPSIHAHRCATSARVCAGPLTRTQQAPRQGGGLDRSRAASASSLAGGRCARTRAPPLGRPHRFVLHCTLLLLLERSLLPECQYYAGVHSVLEFSVRSRYTTCAKTPRAHTLSLSHLAMCYVQSMRRMARERAENCALSEISSKMPVPHHWSGPR